MSTSQMQLGGFGRLLGAAAEQAQRLWAVMSRFSPWVLVLPALAVSSTIGGLYRMVWAVHPPSVYDSLGALLAAGAFVTAASCWVLRGDFFHRWMIYLSGCLWCRAIDLAGTKLGAAVAILILLWYALVKYEEMRPYLQSRLLVSLLVGSLMCQCLPWLFTTSVSAWAMSLGLWPDRVAIATTLAGRIMLWTSILVSEVLCRAGRIAVTKNGDAAERSVVPYTARQTASVLAECSPRSAA